MIKNWLVKTKQIKSKSSGFIRHVQYLKSNSRPTHKHTRITILKNGARSILEEIEQRTKYRQENGIRGGGVRNYATSFVLSLPKTIKQPTPQQWNKIGLYAVKKVADEIGVDFEDLKRISHIVLHQESRSDKHNHIHLLIGNVLDKKVIKGVSQYKATYAVKKSFNYSVKRLLNEDNNDYIPINPNQKDMPLHIARAEKAQNVMDKFTDFKKSFNDWFDSALNKRKALKEAEKAAFDFDNLDINVGDRVAEKMLGQIETIENEFEETHLLIDEKVSKKTRRSRRRRRNK